MDRSTTGDTQLARLQAALLAEHARRARLARRRGLRHRLLALGLTAALAALLPAGILAATPTFSDLGAAAPVHQPNILALANAGLTTGFADPASSNPDVRLYDPKANVTREEMASFLARTAGLGTNPPVANAQTAVSAQTAANAAHATTADQASTATSATSAGTAQSATTAGTAARLATSPAGGTTYAANDLIRASSASDTNSHFLTKDRQTVGAVTMQAPGPGFVLLYGTVLLAGFTSNANVGVQLVWQDAGAGTSLFAAEFDGRQATGEELALSLTPIATLPVASAGAHTYELRAQITGGTGTATVLVVRTQALFVPFGANGSTGP